MANDYFNASGTPSQGSAVVTPNFRAEFAAIGAGFDKLPSLSGNAYKAVFINASASALDVIGGNGLLKLSTTGIPTIAVAGTDYVTDIAATVHAATGKTTPVDADEVGLVDSAASNVLKKLTWANLKATLVATAHTWTAIQTISAAGTPLVINSTNSAVDKIQFKDNGAQTGQLYSSSTYPLLWRNASNGTSFYVDATGNFTATANVTAYSDERLKKNWADLPADFIERLAKVKYGTYDRTDIEQRQIGVSAQSLQTLMPEAVMTDEADMLMVAYGNAALAACIALAEEVVRLRARLDALEIE